MQQPSAQLVIQTAFLGDLILTVPFLRRVKLQSPQEKLILVCKKGLGSFLKQAGLIDEFFEVEKGDRNSYRQARRNLQNYAISYLYCVHRSVRSLLFSAQIQADRKIGFSSLLGFWIFDERVDYQKAWPDAVRKFALLGSRDLEVRKAIESSALVELNQADANGVLPAVPPLFSFAPYFLNSQPGVTQIEKSVAIFPGSVWATKRWTVSGFIEVAQTFVKNGFRVLLLGGPDEKSICDEIGKAVPEATVLAGKFSIAESIDIVSHCELVIANDSAATHMAAMTNTPSITVFGPTTLDLGFRPWSDRARVVQVGPEAGLSCRPCGTHGPKVCPLGHHFCMKKIAPVKVLKAAEALLALSL